MPWGFIGAAVSIFGGISSSRRARKENSAARAQQERMLEETRKQREFAMSIWNQHRETYGDLERILVAEAEQGTVADIEGVSSRAATDTALAFDSARDQHGRQLMGFGLDPSSGRYQAADRQFGLDQSLAESFSVGNARENERRWADEQTHLRRSALHSQGAALTRDAAAGVERANNMVVGGHNAASQMHSQAASQYNNMANNMFAQAGFLGMYAAGGMDWGARNTAAGTGGNFMATPQPGQNSAWNTQPQGMQPMGYPQMGYQPSGGMQPGGWGMQPQSWGYQPTYMS